MRQVRRLRTALGQLKAIGEQPSYLAKQSLQDTWSAIVRAKGFPPSFQAFVAKSLGISIPETIGPADSPLLEWLVQRFQEWESTWTWSAFKQGKQAWDNKLANDWKKGGSMHFRQIRPSPKEAPSIFEIPIPAMIKRHRHGKNGPFWVTLHNEPPPGVTFVEFMDTRRAILDRQGLNLRLDGPIPARQADVQAHLIKVTADPSIIFQVVTEFWLGFWKRDADLNEDELENLLDATENVPPFDPTVTNQEVDNAIAKLSIHKARGPDSWSNGDLKNMPPKIREALCQLFNLINSTGKWPKPLLQATVALLSKTNGSFVIENTRPITILSVIFRLWSKITASKFLLNIRDRLPDAIQGNRPNCASRWLASFTQILAEQALNSNGEFNLASFDLTKQEIWHPRDHSPSILWFPREITAKLQTVWRLVIWSRSPAWGAGGVCLRSVPDVTIKLADDNGNQSPTATGWPQLL